VIQAVDFLIPGFQGHIFICHQILSEKSLEKEANYLLTSEDVTVCRVEHMTHWLESSRGNSAVRPHSWREV